MTLQNVYLIKEYSLGTTWTMKLGTCKVCIMIKQTDDSNKDLFKGRMCLKCFFKIPISSIDTNNCLKRILPAIHTEKMNKCKKWNFKKVYYLTIYYRKSFSPILPRVLLHSHSVWGRSGGGSRQKHHTFYLLK